MNPPCVAEAIRRFAGPLHRCSSRRRTVLERIRDCRTAVLGGHVWRCRSCDHERIAYNSCRDRHCPRCQKTRSRAWLEQRLAQVLPVPHFHAVFTLPEELRPVALGNPRAIYTLLFKAAAATLRIIGQDPKHLGAKLGFFGILHTWGQALVYHPHVHFIIPGGGIALDGSCWVPSRPRFLVSQRVLATLFRRLLLQGLEELRVAGDIDLPPDLRHSHRLRRVLKSLRKKKWVVHLREPFATPTRVFEYLARYTHRVAIADRRIQTIDDDGVVFRYQDYRTGRPQTMRLAGEEFVRRFAQHVLPERFVRIRYYGFLAHRARTANVARCRALIEEGGHGVTAAEATDVASSAARDLGDLGVAGDDETHRCPKCKGPMVCVRKLERGETYAEANSHTRGPPIPV